MRIGKKAAVIISLATVLPLISACAVSPVLFIPLMPVIAAALGLIAAFLGFWVFAAAAAVVFPLWGFNLFAVCAVAFIAAMLLPNMLARRLSPLIYIAVAAAVCAAAAAAVTAITAAVKGCSLQTLISDSYGGIARDPVLRALSRLLYGRAEIAEVGHVKLLPNDELYMTDALNYYALRVSRELDGTAVWYVTGYGAFCGGTGAFISCCLTGAAEKPLCANCVRARELRLGFNYFKIAVLPALAFSLLALYEPMVPVVITVVNLMITLPCCLCGITLTYYIAALPAGKIKAVTLGAYFIAAVALAVFYEWGMLIYSFLGLADCVLNVRKLLNWALS